MRDGRLSTPNTAETHPYRLSIAPMIGHTDKFYRMLLRYLTKRTCLYTDMIHDHVLLQKRTRQNLEINAMEHPVILQIGSDDVRKALEAAKRGVDLGYDEININAGCPSKKLRQKKFGIYLMDNVDYCEEMLATLASNLPLPVSIKCRTGYDGTKYDMPRQDNYEYLHSFVTRMKNAGAARVSIHARIAIIGGINPELNRTIPPLNYDAVYKIAKDFEGYPIELNGNVNSLESALEHLQFLDAVMIGREAVNNPLMFYDADEIFFGKKFESTMLALHKNRVAHDVQRAHDGQKSYDVQKANDAQNANDNQHTHPQYAISTTKPDIIFAHAKEMVLQYSEYVTQQMQLAQDARYRLYISQSIRHLLNLFDQYSCGVAWKQAIKNSLASSDAPDIAIKAALQTLFL